MLVKQVPCCAHTHEHAAVVAVVEGGHGAVQDAPAADHVIFVAVVFDVLDAAGVGGEGEDGVGEVGGRGAEGVDFLVLKSAAYVYLMLPNDQKRAVPV